ncbi:MAG: hypothetical protein LBT08_07225, partial [Synergistaceae bacterium]|nr:hypothetical protein [Synergistaceae bacterium]
MACLEDVTVGSSVIGIAGNAPVIVVAVKWSFDLAVHTSTIEPLPHQISAVYQEMLPRLPLRYILADDPEEKVADQASAASTISELEAEILMLKKLERMANDVRASGKDRKWDELSQLLQDNENMFGTEGAREKLIIFTEHRDTLRYLIGQTEVCHLWNLVSIETREGMVFQRLFEKLEQEREALKGKVFDILGKVTFNNKPL